MKERPKRWWSALRISLLKTWPFKFYITQMHFFGCILLRKEFQKHGRWASLQHKWITTVHELSHLLHGHTTWILQNAATTQMQCSYFAVSSIPSQRISLLQLCCPHKSFSFEERKNKLSQALDNSLCQILLSFFFFYH